MKGISSKPNVSRKKKKELAYFFMEMNMAFLCFICKQRMSMLKELNHSKKPAWNREKHEKNVVNVFKWKHT